MSRTILEQQTNADGTVIPLVYCFPDGQEQAAESKYHDVLRYAAISAVPVHSAIMVDGTGKHIRHECYVHEIPEPEQAEDPEKVMEEQAETEPAEEEQIESDKGLTNEEM